VIAAVVRVTDPSDCATFHVSCAGWIAAEPGSMYWHGEEQPESRIGSCRTVKETHTMSAFDHLEAECARLGLTSQPVQVRSPNQWKRWVREKATRRFLRIA
jgi:hypothetical protein